MRTDNVTIGELTAQMVVEAKRLGQETLATMTIDDVQRFILKVALEIKTSALHDLFLYLRHFHTFLKEIGENAPDGAGLFCAFFNFAHLEYFIYGLNRA